VSELLAEKDEIIRMNDEIIRKNDELILAIEKIIHIKEENYAYVVAKRNGQLMNLQHRLELRFAVEDFKKKVHGRNDITDTKTLMGGNDSTNEATWYEILQSNMDQIATHLVDEDRPMTADEVKKWVAVALDLHRISLSDAYASSFYPSQIHIDTSLVTGDTYKLAVAVCEKLPVHYIASDPEHSTVHNLARLGTNGSLGI
jgi:hypothetical protein